MSNLGIFLLLISTIWCHCEAKHRKPLSGQRYFQLLGIHSDDLKTRWDRFYGDRSYRYGKKPAQFLAENINLIPPKSKILDVGMGEGRNAVFLAKQGHQVIGIDISEVGIKKAHMLAQEMNVRIDSVLLPIEKYNPRPNTFDVIVCFYYVNKEMHKKMLSWLKPGGLLLYEAYTKDQKSVKGFEDHPDEYLIEKGELTKMFPKLEIIKYEEPTKSSSHHASAVFQLPMNKDNKKSPI